jgi:hypothetical protein
MLLSDSTILHTLQVTFLARFSPGLRYLFDFGTISFNMLAKSPSFNDSEILSAMVYDVFDVQNVTSSSDVNED